jgi:hypothetical protein
MIVPRSGLSAAAAAWTFGSGIRSSHASRQ